MLAVKKRNKFLKQSKRVPLQHIRLRIQHCHHWGLGRYSGAGLIPGPQLPACCGCQQNRKRKCTEVARGFSPFSLDSFKKLTSLFSLLD